MIRTLLVFFLSNLKFEIGTSTMLSQQFKTLDSILFLKFCFQKKTILSIRKSSKLSSGFLRENFSSKIHFSFYNFFFGILMINGRLTQLSTFRFPCQWLSSTSANRFKLKTWKFFKISSKLFKALQTRLKANSSDFADAESRFKGALDFGTLLKFPRRILSVGSRLAKSLEKSLEMNLKRSKF